jgi:hypothetical protein
MQFLVKAQITRLCQPLDTSEEKLTILVGKVTQRALIVRKPVFQEVFDKQMSGYREVFIESTKYPSGDLIKFFEC